MKNAVRVSGGIKTVTPYINNEMLDEIIHNLKIGGQENIDAVIELLEQINVKDYIFKPERITQ